MVSPHRPTLPYKVSLFLITPPVAWSINMVRSYLYSVTPGPFWTPPLTLRPSTKGKCLPGWSYMCVLYNAAQFSTALAWSYMCVCLPRLWSIWGGSQAFRTDQPLLKHHLGLFLVLKIHAQKHLSLWSKPYQSDPLWHRWLSVTYVCLICIFFGGWGP